jgi:hypothetical protein
MLKRSSLLALGIVALAVPWLSDLGVANQPNNPPLRRQSPLLPPAPLRHYCSEIARTERCV